MCKIINLAERKRKLQAEADADKSQPLGNIAEYNFASIEKTNAELAEKRAKERQQANKAVLCSYHIKH